eukprot:359920-Chlamydomonas_euryale.AAC.2
MDSIKKLNRGLQASLGLSQRYTDNLLGQSLEDQLRIATAKTLEAPDATVNQQHGVRAEHDRDSGWGSGCECKGFPHMRHLRVSARPPPPPFHRDAAVMSSAHAGVIPRPRTTRGRSSSGCVEVARQACACQQAPPLNLNTLNAPLRCLP